VEDEDVRIGRGQFRRSCQENSGVIDPPTVARFKSGRLQVQSSGTVSQISIPGPGRLAVHAYFTF